MKKAIFFPPSCSSDKQNEFESCRGEGRAVINLAFGLSLLDYECYIINNWNITSPKKIWNNVYVNNHPDINETYDLAISFDNYQILNSNNYIHKIVLNYTHTDTLLDNIKKNRLDIIIACPVPSAMHNPSTFQHKNVKYLPVPYPIPSINIGFIPYKFKPKQNELKVYLYHSAWGNSSSASIYWNSKQLLILDFLKSKRYSLELFVHVENEEAKENAKVAYELSKYPPDKIHYIYNEKVHYDDIIKTLMNVDLCLPVGGYDYLGSSVNDIISLGKPMIYAVNGPPRPPNSTEFTHNGLYDCPNYLIVSQESYHESWQKLERLFPNQLEESFNCYRNFLKDFDFPIWKQYTEKLLNEIKS